MNMLADGEPRYVVGLDLSLTSTGIAVYDTKRGMWRFDNPKTVGHRQDTWAQQTRRVYELAERICAAIPLHTLVVVEGPSYNSVSTSVWERAALYYQLTIWLQELEIPIAVAAPKTLKLWATGTGMAGKKSVQNVAEQFVGRKLANNDVADATVLALMGMHRLGLISPPGVWRAKTVTRIEWPDGGLTVWR
ncbi:hypothetical protein [Mobiluncus curtisii]|uniref:hypothetical protein n=1 Tax=Mobiluncus curtisii TaxID=2051 RepID=UPI00146FE9D5|nr:hypothetical protein [Mobiluncus curtisii]NMW48919.1 hypothetical protein [Mobiluncus curtisii]NMW89034.1 hypothetical protein [Mobiluncus curtisii]